jgi:hypothetical protein
VKRRLEIAKTIVVAGIFFTVALVCISAAWKGQLDLANNKTIVVLPQMNFDFVGVVYHQARLLVGVRCNL